ncbi:hypothetical protein Pmani_030744 [Petrolisthes manimaculis]|uniref:Uncharacterized protein n=1 Tax=Petrolisthes manimaculis TaxID=1843537 RepID=A0AAE1NWJ0_9EUCA|nr:hypothetical protein Pmani_030744 [Petrolisthes manimaculis]
MPRDWLPPSINPWKMEGLANNKEILLKRWRRGSWRRVLEKQLRGGGEIGEVLKEEVVKEEEEEEEEGEEES